MTGELMNPIITQLINKNDLVIPKPESNPYGCEVLHAFLLNDYNIEILGEKLTLAGYTWFGGSLPRNHDRFTKNNIIYCYNDNTITYLPKDNYLKAEIINDVKSVEYIFCDL